MCQRDEDSSVRQSLTSIFFPRAGIHHPFPRFWSRQVLGWQHGQDCYPRSGVCSAVHTGGPVPRAAPLSRPGRGRFHPWGGEVWPCPEMFLSQLGAGVLLAFWGADAWCIQVNTPERTGRPPPTPRKNNQPHMWGAASEKPRVQAHLGESLHPAGWQCPGSGSWSEGLQKFRDEVWLGGFRVAPSQVTNRALAVGGAWDNRLAHSPLPRVAAASTDLEPPSSPRTIVPGLTGYRMKPGSRHSQTCSDIFILWDYSDGGEALVRGEVTSHTKASQVVQQ